jgi:CRP-like cAMP-binding protein
VFGELGILNRKPRTATIICLEDTQFASLDAKDYEEILMKVEKQKLGKKVRFIAEAVSNNLSIEKMSKIVYFFVKKKYCMGDKIF